MNVVFAAVFVFLNSWALKNNFEETFVFLSFLCGAVAIFGNAIFVFLFCKKYFSIFV